ncbi:MAG: class I SAM-dependent methyltransferase [Candidatus Omnitrophica bacterium]|nr:class I SAM-dependent methyltransferase [Candidatus Omnitrophota bacterium]
MDIVSELFEWLPRQGPGSNATTRKALSLIPSLPKNPRILDAGCGTGLTSVQLAHQTGGKVSAVDIHKPFLEQVKIYAQLTSLSDNVEICHGSMESLPFRKESFDLLWSEGALYLIGFQKGLAYWRDFLKKGGCACVSELSWLSGERPEEPKRFWARKYPAMQGIEENLTLTEKAGYKPLHHFILPESDWWENYYGPMAKRISDLKVQSMEYAAVLAPFEEEIRLFKNHNASYGYVFYILQRA